MLGNNRDSPVAPQKPSQINEDVRIRGTITVSEPLVMAGQLDGDVNADKLYVASTAIITGEITAQSLTIDGRVLGSIVADKVFLSATAHFEGQLYCQDVAVDDGAYVNAKFTKEPVTNG
ncbi:polymer-forming cytoskeletal protein [Alphaproteobacteria bacterium]|nr:polymer-forming cytoskeletal protein [Alphaproteobacteria bacterium]